MTLLRNNGLPPPPNPDSDINDYSWRDWFKQLRDYVVSAGTILWSQIDFSGSKISDIQNRPHQNLQNLQGGTTSEYFHLTNTEYTGTGTGTFVRQENPTINNANISGTLDGTTTDLAGGAANRIPYQTDVDTTAFIAAPSVANTYLQWNGTSFSWGGGGSGGGGTVTSVDLAVPTGLTVSGNPITTSGTITIGLATGYSIPTTTSQANWDSAYTQRLQWDGGSTNLVASTGRTSLGGTTVGQNVFTLTNPSAVSFLRFNADNSVSTLDATDFRIAIGAGTGNGTVTGVTATSPVLSSGTVAPVISLASEYGDTLNPYGTKTANYVLAAPNGSNGTPSFRALAIADIPRSTPVTKTADFSVASTEQYFIINKTGSSCTVTLPTASTNAGRVLYFINHQDQATVSASSNVIAREGGAASTAILPAVAGNWSMLISDGTNWVTFANSFANCS